MYTGRTVFSQLIDFFPKKQFDRCVRQHRGNHRIKTFSCFDQYLCMTFAQITYRQSLRDIETCLRAIPHYRRESPRCKYPRRTGFRTRCNLHNGPWLPRFRSSFYLYSKPFNFYHESQKQFRLSPSLLSQVRQKHRFAMRPNDKTQWLLCIAGLSCCSSSNQLLRQRDKQKIRIFNKQLYSAGFDNCITLQMPLADRNIFQMDQAIPAYQDVLWHHQERCEDSNLDCHQRLRSGCDCQVRNSKSS